MTTAHATVTNTEQTTSKDLNDPENDGAVTEDLTQLKRDLHASMTTMMSRLHFPSVFAEISGAESKSLKCAKRLPKAKCANFVITQFTLTYKEYNGQNFM